MNEDDTEKREGDTQKMHISDVPSGEESVSIKDGKFEFTPVGDDDPGQTKVIDTEGNDTQIMDDAGATQVINEQDIEIPKKPLWEQRLERNRAERERRAVGLEPHQISDMQREKAPTPQNKIPSALAGTLGTGKIPPAPAPVDEPNALGKMLTGDEGSCKENPTDDKKFVFAGVTGNKRITGKVVKPPAPKQASETPTLEAIKHIGEERKIKIVSSLTELVKLIPPIAENPDYKTFKGGLDLFCRSEFGESADDYIAAFGSIENNEDLASYALKVMVPMLIQKYSDVSAKMEAADEEKKQLEEKIETLEAKVKIEEDPVKGKADILDANITYRKQIKGHQDNEKKWVTEKQELEEKLKQSNAGAQDAIKEVAKLKAEVQELQRKTVPANQDDIKKLEAKLKAAQNELTQYKSAGASLEKQKEVDELKAKILSQQQELQELKTANTGIDTDLAEELSGLRTRLKNKEEELAEYKKDCAKFEDEITPLRANQDGAKKAAEEYRERNLELQTEIDGLNRQLFDVRSDKQEAEAKKSELEEMMNKVEGTIDSDIPERDKYAIIVNHVRKVPYDKKGMSGLGKLVTIVGITAAALIYAVSTMVAYEMGTMEGRKSHVEKVKEPDIAKKVRMELEKEPFSLDMKNYETSLRSFAEKYAGKDVTDKQVHYIEQKVLIPMLKDGGVDIEKHKGKNVVIKLGGSN